MPSAITGTPYLAASPTGYSGANNTLGQAIQTIWSKEILFQAMPVLRFEQFAVKKTELGVQPGLTINFMRYNNLPNASQLVEGVRLQTVALTASQFSITVAEQGFAVSVTELLLNASFDDVMASASRLLGRNMAQYLDYSARNTLLLASSVIFGYNQQNLTRDAWSPYDYGSAATSTNGLSGSYYFSPRSLRTPCRRWLPRTCLGSEKRTCASSTPHSHVGFVTRLSSLRSRSTPPPATSPLVRSAVCGTLCSSRRPRSTRH